MVVVGESLMNHSFGVFALRGAASAEKVFVFDDPELFAVIEAEFFPGFDVCRGEKTNAWKPEILMIHEHLKNAEKEEIVWLINLLSLLG